ncbi:MAG TPA: AI-2E family transporter [Paludibacteraceae bacterium]|nr:AI-2E family transporter [Paludibacteraceae bacterium]
MNSLLKLPFYTKAAIFCVGIYVFVAMMFIGKDIIVPFLFGTIIAILLHPVVVFFERRKINRILAIIITLLLSFGLIATFALFMFSQISRFSDSWPAFVDKFTNLLNQAIKWAPGYFDISVERVNDMINRLKTEMLNTSSSFIGQTIVSVGSGIMVVLLIPVYVFLMLFYKPLLVDFIYKLFNDERHGEVKEIITQSKTVIQRYLMGLLIETMLVAALNSIGLLILGIDYAVLIGIIGALLNLIPYIGGLVAVALPMMLALITKESPWFVLYVMAIYIFIQIVDNNYIVPKIVASKVRINALVSIIVVLVGGALWGVSGMFLSIPLIAIIKVIFDRIESLKPIGFLLGDTMPEIIIFKIKRTKK